MKNETYNCFLTFLAYLPHDYIGKASDFNGVYNVNRCGRACTGSNRSRIFFRLFAFKVCVILYLNPHPPAVPQPHHSAAPQPDSPASTSSSGGFKVTPSSGDGRSFFRSLVIGMDSR